MAEQLPQEQMVTMEELVVSHAYEMTALVTIKLCQHYNCLHTEQVYEIDLNLPKCYQQLI